jgi:hypothetical protein
MKRHRLDLGSGMSVESYRDWNGRVYIASTGRASMMFNDLKLLRRFLGLPAKTASREKLDAWLAGLDPVVDHETPVGDPQDLATTGFGPEHHGDALDPSDPNHNTRTIL